MQFAALPHTDQKQPPTPIHLIHTTHTHLEFVSRACLFSQLNDFSWFCHFMFGSLRVSAHFFFFHADSLTRLSSWRKERSLLLPERRPERRRNTTSHPECFFTPARRQQPGQPELLRPVVTRLSLPSADIASQKATKRNQIVTNDDLRPGLDYFSFVK